MSFVVYEKDRTKRIDKLQGGPDRTSFPTMEQARAARTRFLRTQELYDADDILIAPGFEFYASIEKSETGRSAKDGTPVTVKANIDYCCDPRFERYWSM